MLLLNSNNQLYIELTKLFQTKIKGDNLITNQLTGEIGAMGLIKILFNSLIKICIKIKAVFIMKVIVPEEEEKEEVKI